MSSPSRSEVPLLRLCLGTPPSPAQPHTISRELATPQFSLKQVEGDTRISNIIPQCLDPTWSGVAAS